MTHQPHNETDMVERVARAMHMHDHPDSEAWKLFSDDWKEIYRDRARAAIKAMREPSEEMLEAGGVAALKADFLDLPPDHPGHSPGSRWWLTACASWNAMIDTALNPQTLKGEG